MGELRDDLAAARSRAIGSSSLVARASSSGRSASIRAFEKMTFTRPRYLVCSGGSSSIGSSGSVRGCDGGMIVVPTTAEVNDSWSSAALVTSS